MNGRIVFDGSPWPDGHEANVSIGIVFKGEGEPLLTLELKSADYNEGDANENDGSEKETEADEDDGWRSKIVWTNYHRATIGGDVALPNMNGRFDLRTLDGVKLTADVAIAQGLEEFDWDELAFDDCYIQGHDAVAGHNIQLQRNPNGSYRLEWHGRVASAYIGDYEFKHAFYVQANVRLDRLTLLGAAGDGLDQAKASLKRCFVQASEFSKIEVNGDDVLFGRA